MNFRFNTGSERINVLEDLRKPTITFPPTWDLQKTRQKDSMAPSNKYHHLETDPFTLLVITWLLQHEPQKRPSAFDLSQSSLLPTSLEDEYFKGALRLMGKFPLMMY